MDQESFLRILKNRYDMTTKDRQKKKYYHNLIMEIQLNKNIVTDSYIKQYNDIIKKWDLFSKSIKKIILLEKPSKIEVFQNFIKISSTILKFQ